jgi:ABC-2 type transport system permease protein
MNLSGVLGIVRRHLYESLHNLDRVADTLFWPVLDVVVWGFFTLYLSGFHRIDSLGGPAVPPAKATACILDGIILWGVFRSFQRDLAVGFLVEVWSRNMINLFMAPLTFSEYLAGLIAINLVKALIGLTASCIVARCCYELNVILLFGVMLPYVLMLLCWGLAVGVVTTSLILRFSTGVQTLAYSIAGLLMPFSCVFYPVTVLPARLKAVAMLIPATDAMEGMRQAVSGNGLSPTALVHGFGLCGIYLVVAFAFFKWMFESARARGLLVKLD